MRYLTIEFGLGFFSFSLLFLSCLSSAQSGTHLTHTLPVTHALPGGQLQSQHQNIIHMAMSSPPPLLLTLSFTTPRLVRAPRTRSHGHSYKPLTSKRARTPTSIRAQRERDGRGRFCGMLREEWEGWGNESETRGREKRGRGEHRERGKNSNIR